MKLTTEIATILIVVATAYGCTSQENLAQRVEIAEPEKVVLICRAVTRETRERHNHFRRARRIAVSSGEVQELYCHV
jgi:hypothetical protein